MAEHRLFPYFLILGAGIVWGATFSLALIATAQGAHPLVLFQRDIAGFRATQMIQVKAQPAGNGMPFTRAATLDCIIWVAPFGRAVRQSLAALHLLTRTGPKLAPRAGPSP
jgi:hypothetical protein